MSKKKEINKEETHTCLPGQMHLFETKCSMCEEGIPIQVIEGVAIEKPKILIEIDESHRYSKIVIPKDLIGSIEFLVNKEEFSVIKSLENKEIVILPIEGNVKFL